MRVDPTPSLAGSDEATLPEEHTCALRGVCRHALSVLGGRLHWSSEEWVSYATSRVLSTPYLQCMPV